MYQLYQFTKVEVLNSVTCTCVVALADTVRDVKLNTLLLKFCMGIDQSLTLSYPMTAYDVVRLSAALCHFWQCPWGLGSA